MVSKPPRWAWGGPFSVPLCCEGRGCVCVGFPGGKGARAGPSWPWLRDVHQSDAGSGTQPCALPSWEEFSDSSICDGAGDEPFPHPNPNFPTGKSSRHFWVCFATVGSLKLGSGLSSGRGFCSFWASGEVLKIPQHFREKALLFSPVLIVWAGGE